MTEQDNDTPQEAGTETGEPGIDPKLLEILVCPVTRERLRYDRNANELISDKARLAYPIRDGIPIMLEAEARSLDD